jgi:phasin family protein
MAYRPKQVALYFRYTDDFILPTGNLRESRSGADRANIVVVTKCPRDLSVEEQNTIRKKLKLNVSQELYFSCIAYDDFVFSKDKTIAVKDILYTDKLLLAGIAKPDQFFAHLKQTNDICLTFPDHHHFEQRDILEIERQAQKQVEILQKTMEELAQAMGAGKPLENAAKQGELVQHAMEKAFTYMQELAEVARKAQTEALDVINKRAQQNIQELTSLVQSKK